jgi:Tol biopolymer transport system component
MKSILLFLLLSWWTCQSFSQTKNTRLTKQVTNKVSISQNLPLKDQFDNLPIKPARTIQFTTKEASWIDVNVSPDGKTLLCSFLGNLYRLPSKGGTATQLTQGLAINRYPVWSPDGKYFAYISDASGFLQVHIRDTAGNFHKVLGELKNRLNPEILWFPDSRKICVDNREIFNLSGETSSLSKKIKSLMRFSSDDRFIYYVAELPHDSSALIRSNRFTGEKNNLLVYHKPVYKTNLFRAKMSPDGNWLAYIKYDYINGNPSPADSLIIVDVKTGTEKLLAHLGIKFTGYLVNQHYSFSSDSKYLFIGYGGKIHRIEITAGKNEIIPFTANVKVDMGALDYHTFPVSLDSFEVKFLRSAKKSPDSKHLVFSALSKIYVMDLPNGAPRPLVAQPFGQFQPNYSPDGKWIAYVSWNDTIGGHLWKVSSDGRNLEQLTTTAGLYQHPSWSPDGKMIVVAKGNNKLSNYRYSPGDGKMDVITIADKSVKQIDDTVPLFNNPVFSGDGKQILYKPNQNWSRGKILQKLVSLNLATNIKRDVITARTIDEMSVPIRQILLSPDNRYVVFMFNDDLYLASMITMGNSQLILDEKEPITLIRFARGCIDPVWQDGGKTLAWLNVNQYCSINPDKIIGEAMHLRPNQPIEGLPNTKIIDVNIPADKTITIQLKVPRQYGHGIIALKNARIITMRGQDVIENGTVIIENGIVVSLGKINKMKVPENATVIDLTGKIIMPGLIDVHSHMGAAIPPDVFYQQTWQRLLNLSYGVTTRRDPAATVDEFGYDELTETGQMLGPRAFSVGNAVYDNYDLINLKEAITQVNNRTKYGATYIKQYYQPTRLQRQLLLQACKKAEVNMTNEGDYNPLSTIGQFKDGSTGVEHNPIWGDTYDDIIKLVAKSGTYFCPTLQVCYGQEEGKHYFRKLYGRDFINRSARFLPDSNDQYMRLGLLKDMNVTTLDSGFLQQSRIDSRIKHAGGKIVMGSHGEDQGIGVHWEIWALQMGGLTNMEALQTATITAAEALGMQKDLGSIEVGKIADLIILDKNPLQDIHNTTSIKYVMKAGVLYNSETLDEIWPEKKKCPEWQMQSDNK